MKISFGYETDAGLFINMSVSAPASFLTGAFADELSPEEKRALFRRAFDQSMPQVSSLLASIAGQVDPILQQSLINSMMSWVKENTPPLDTPLASVAGEHRS